MVLLCTDNMVELAVSSRRSTWRRQHRVSEPTATFRPNRGDWIDFETAELERAGLLRRNWVADGSNPNGQLIGRFRAGHSSHCNVNGAPLS